MSLGPKAKPQQPPRSSSAGLREGLRIYQSMQADDKAAQKLLEEMIAVQEHNEEAFAICQEAFKAAVAEATAAEAATAELAVRQASHETRMRQEYDNVKAREDALAEKEADLALLSSRLKDRESALVSREENLREIRTKLISSLENA